MIVKQRTTILVKKLFNDFHSTNQRHVAWDKKELNIHCKLFYYVVGYMSKVDSFWYGMDKSKRVKTVWNFAQKGHTMPPDNRTEQMSYHSDRTVIRNGPQDWRVLRTLIMYINTCMNCYHWHTCRYMYTCTCTAWEHQALAFDISCLHNLIRCSWICV